MFIHERQAVIRGYDRDTEPTRQNSTLQSTHWYGKRAITYDIHKRITFNHLSTILSLAFLTRVNVNTFCYSLSPLVKILSKQTTLLLMRMCIQTSHSQRADFIKTINLIRNKI